MFGIFPSPCVFNQITSLILQIIYLFYHKKKHIFALSNAWNILNTYMQIFCFCLLFLFSVNENKLNEWKSHKSSRILNRVFSAKLKLKTWRKKRKRIYIHKYLSNMRDKTFWEYNLTNQNWISILLFWSQDTHISFRWTE